ncbi:nicotinamide riboside transporter PnuC [Alteromonas lipolytica]|uniref:Nicotinamide riboside transporter PnuC n=1 Tax=Alteromonas lipolytica TaxID=1856405 RepID=A0A1E8FJ13_9ALTE|nr:nicotinamide riboside transporter PnuC [Alteromonas lipolytica]OFI35920.1 transporter [Alteromonas lipolytica]GGF72574.1 nicotinamide mononucleotide transporter [Alteromonas lipolytica]
MEQSLSRFVEQVLATSVPEWLAVILAIAYVLLAARQSAWCWAAALASTAIYTWLFWQVALPFQSVLNFFYMIMAVYGYWQWHHQPGQTRSIQSWPLSWHLATVFGLTAVAVVLGKLAASQFNGEYLWLDAAINVFSVATTFMVAHKVLQNWLYWLVINTAAVFLYWQSGLILSACLFLGYVGFSLYGYSQWKREWSGRYQTSN